VRGILTDTARLQPQHDIRCFFSGRVPRREVPYEGSAALLLALGKCLFDCSRHVELSLERGRGWRALEARGRRRGDYVLNNESPRVHSGGDYVLVLKYWNCDL
jgi:hypothetical protein